MESWTNFFEILDVHARDRGKKTAIYAGDEEVSYEALRQNINRFGNVLKNCGVAPGQRVALAIPDAPASFYAFFGALKCGIIPALISPDLSRSDYESILCDCGAAALITIGASEAAGAGDDGQMRRILLDDPGFPALMAQAEDCLRRDFRPPQDVSFIQYTSGSTGQPKGVAHTQRDMLFSARQYAGGILQMTDQDIVFSASKLFFAYGFGNSLIFPLYYGASSVLFPDKPTPDDIWRIIARYRPTLFFSVPTFYHMLIKTLEGPVLLPSVRLCISAGEALPADTYRIWKDLTGLEIIDGIGSTEALHIFISNRPSRVCPGTSGWVVPGYETRIVGEDGLPVAEGCQGILHIRGNSTSPFYWNRPAESAQNMLPGGWLMTGDYYVEEKGCYTYQGRQDDLFKVGGAWVSPVKVEEAMRSHPAVLECAVTSRKLEGLLLPIAYVVLQSGHQETGRLTREIRHHVLGQLPGHMCPVQICYVEEIPKTRTGKIQRYALKNEFHEKEEL